MISRHRADNIAAGKKGVKEKEERKERRYLLSNSESPKEEERTLKLDPAK